MVAGQIVGFDQSPLIALTPHAANRFSCHPVPFPLTWLGGRRDRRDSRYPHPLIRLGYAVALEHVLPVRVHHLTLYGLIGRRWLLYDRWRAVDRIWVRVGVAGISVVGVGEEEAAEVVKAPESLEVFVAASELAPVGSTSVESSFVEPATAVNSSTTASQSRRASQSHHSHRENRLADNRHLLDATSIFTF